MPVQFKRREITGDAAMKVLEAVHLAGASIVDLDECYSTLRLMSEISLIPKGCVYASYTRKLIPCAGLPLADIEGFPEGCALPL